MKSLKWPGIFMNFSITLIVLFLIDEVDIIDILK